MSPSQHEYRELNAQALWNEGSAAYASAPQGERRELSQQPRAAAKPPPSFPEVTGCEIQEEERGESDPNKEWQVVEVE